MISTHSGKEEIMPCIFSLLRIVGNSSFTVFPTETIDKLTVTQFDVLSTLATDAKVLCQGDISHRSGVDRSTVSTSVRLLERMGMISRVRSDNDQRQALWRLTRSGGHALGRTIQAAGVKEQLFMEPLTISQQAAFVEALTVLADRFRPKEEPAEIGASGEEEPNKEELPSVAM